MPPDWVLSGLIAAICSWATMRAELRYLRRDIDAAHTRLDKHGAPASWLPMP